MAPARSRELAPAIVLSGHLAAMGAVRCLGAAGIPVVVVHHADSDFAHRSRFVQARVRAPDPETDPAGYLEVLRDLAARFGRGLLLPANDATLALVARHLDDLQVHHEVVAAPESVIERIVDKRHTYELAAALGIPAPRTSSPASREEAAAVGRTFLFPCLVKPRVSHRYAQRFGRKLTRVHDLDGLLTEYDRAAAAGLEVLVQEYIPGDDSLGWNHDVYRTEDRRIEFTARKIRLAPPEFGLPRVVVAARRADLSEPAERLLSALGYLGYACTEFKVDPRDDLPKLLEVNGRVNRSILHPLGVGLNYPALIYRHRMLGETPSYPGQPDRRVYWIDLASDLRYAPRGVRAEGLRRYLRPYRGPRILAVGDGWDPMPFLVRSVGTLGGRWGRLERRLRRGGLGLLRRR